MIYTVDCYTGGSILTREFETLQDVCIWIFELDVTDYQTINIYKHENETIAPVDFTGIRVNADCVRSDSEGQGQGD